MNMRRRMPRLAVMTLLVISSSHLFAAQDVTLRYRWTKGEELRYRITQESNVAMSGVPGVGDMTVATMMTQNYLLAATDVAADGTGTLQMLIESIRLDVSGPMGTMTFDSAAPAGAPADPAFGPVMAMFKALVGEPITLVMSPTGVVQKVEGMSRIAGKLQQAGAQTQPLGMPGLDAFMSDDAMRSTLGQSFGQFPDKAVKPGESWKTELKMPNPLGVMVVSSTHTFKGMESAGGRELARIASAATISSASTAEAPQMPIPMTVEIGAGTAESDALFDPKSGRLQRGTGRATIPMTMNMTAPDGTAVSMQAVTKANTTVELIEKEKR